MKRIILLVAFAFPLLALGQQQQFKVKGMIKGAAPKAKAYLVYQEGSNMVQDSCILKNGAFQFAGRLNEAKEASLVLAHTGIADFSQRNLDVVSIYLENGTALVQGRDSLSLCTISGTPLNLDNQQRIKLLKSLAGKSEKEEIKAMASFVDAHPASLVSLDWLIAHGGGDNTVANKYATLSKALRNTVRGKELGTRVKANLATKIGKVAPDFTLNDQYGKPVKLSSFRGKYVLLDFWASWCKPCRAGQPLLASMYNEWKDTGKFIILSVSLDKEKTTWLKAIEEDKAIWPQVADLNVTVNKAAELYGVSIIPASYLIDPDGKIISQGFDKAFVAKKMVEFKESKQ